MRTILQAILLPLAQAVFRTYRPTVVAVTGTVGKTGTKNAIAAALGGVMRVRASEKNDNTEIGAAVTVLGISSPGRSVFGWIRVFVRGVALLLGRDKDYPAVLVLEFAAQYPGDIAKLCALFPPTIGVLTSIGATHAEHLGGLEGVAKEKGTLLAALPKDGTAVVNADDPRALVAAVRSKARVIRYGLAPQATIRGIEPRPKIGRDAVQGLFAEGMVMKVEIGGNLVPVFLGGAIGIPAVSSALAAIAVGTALGASPLALADSLRDVQLQKGRLRLIPGIKHATILDDTYNASTASMIEALRALRSIPLDEGERRIAVLGDMREMGAHAEEEHEKVGRAAVESGIDRLITVGERSRDIGRAAKAAGFPEDRYAHFGDVVAAGAFVQDLLGNGDLVLVKGSRGMHLERVVKELMAEPLLAEELLVFGEPTT